MVWKYKLVWKNINQFEKFAQVWKIWTSFKNLNWFKKIEPEVNLNFNVYMVSQVV